MLKPAGWAGHTRSPRLKANLARPVADCQKDKGSQITIESAWSACDERDGRGVNPTS
jgi:hypothetical protein